MVQRLTYRRRHAYATKSNRVRVVKTPGALSWRYLQPQRSAADAAGAADGRRH